MALSGVPSQTAKTSHKMVVASHRSAVFLDRDGVICRSKVINGKPFAPRLLEEFRLLPRVVESVQQLKQAGFYVIVVTNQPDIGNGLVAPSVVDAMHERMRYELELDDILMCPHKQTAGCFCRKPQPGMILSAAKRFGIDLSASFMVGDRRTDILSGISAGCYTIFVRRGSGYGENRGIDIPANKVVGSLPAATRHILERVNHVANRI